MSKDKNKDTTKNVALFVLVLFATVLMASCSAIMPEPTPTPSCYEMAESAGYFDALDDLEDRWIDLITIADSTPRIQLAPIVRDMQNIANEVERLETPACAQDITDAFTKHAESMVDAFLSFMGDSEESIVETKFETATNWYGNYLDARFDLEEEALMLTPSPEPTE